MKINRRQFTLGSTTLLLSGMLPLKVNSSMLDKKKNLVVIMLRGAMDGLTSVPYIHDNTLEKVRPDIVVKKLLDLNDQLFDIFDLDDPRRADLIKEINKLQREKAELEGREYDADLEDER